MRCLMLMLALWSLQVSVDAAAEPADPVAVGQRIYAEGRGQDGEALVSVVNGMTSPAALACVNCHRESGMGTSESGTTVPPVAWKLLSRGGFLGHDYGQFRSLRPDAVHYDRDSFYRLITTGVDPAGRQLSPTMPRYALSREQSDALVDYLQTLYPVDAGVDEDSLNLAVVIDPRLPEALRRQHRLFLERLIRMKNSATRREGQRKRFAPVQKIPEYRAYRKWRLHFWELDDSPSAWPQELERRYREQPVFALLAPLLQSDFARVAGFCEQVQLPCLFPPLSASSGNGFYSFVFDDAPRRLREYIEALQRQDRMLFTLDERGRIQPLNEAGLPARLSADDWYRFVRGYEAICNRDGILLLTLADGVEPRSKGLDCAPSPRLQVQLLIAGSDYAHFRALMKAVDAPALCVVSNYAEPRRAALRERRVSALTRQLDLPSANRELLVKDLFTFSLLADAINKLNGAFSRRYLLEVLEHMLNSFPNYTLYREISGAPYQRYIAGAWRVYCGGEPA